MGLEIYTSQNAVPATSQTADTFNKAAISAESIYSRIQLSGAMVKITPGFGRTFTKGTPYKIPVDAAIYDSDGFFKGNNQVIVPSGYSYAEVWAGLRFPFGNWRLSIYRRGVAVYSFVTSDTTVSNKYSYGFVKTPLLNVTTADYFEVYVTQLGTGTETFDQTFLSGYSGSLATEQASAQDAFLIIRGYPS